MDRCPICDVSVKPENLLRHLNDIHPRHPDTSALREKLAEDPGRTAKRASGRPIHIRRWHVALVVLIVLGGVGAYYVAEALTASRPFPCVTTPEQQLPIHWHTVLNIYSGAAKITIPAGIGLTAFCIEPLHTHDTSGTIHIESDVTRTYTVGDFFLVWRKSFDSPTQMLVNGSPVTPSPNVVMHDQDLIEIHYASFQP